MKGKGGRSPLLDGKTAQVVLTSDLLLRLDTVAQQQTTSRSLLIRRACEHFLQKEEKQADQETA